MNMAKKNAKGGKKFIGLNCDGENNTVALGVEITTLVFK